LLMLCNADTNIKSHIATVGPKRNAGVIE